VSEYQGHHSRWIVCLRARVCDSESLCGRGGCSGAGEGAACAVRVVYFKRVPD
jgi:hypothetical protein